MASRPGCRSRFGWRQSAFLAAIRFLTQATYLRSVAALLLLRVYDIIICMACATYLIRLLFVATHLLTAEHLLAKNKHMVSLALSTLPGLNLGLLLPRPACPVLRDERCNAMRCMLQHAAV